MKRTWNRFFSLVVILTLPELYCAFISDLFKLKLLFIYFYPQSSNFAIQMQIQLLLSCAYKCIRTLGGSNSVGERGSKEAWLEYKIQF